MNLPFSHRPPRPKVAVIGGMMAYFESIMEPGFRDDRQNHVTEIVHPLQAVCDLTELGLWAEPGDEDPMLRQLQNTAFDVVLLIPTMATPPSRIAALVEKIGLPVVIACGHGLTEVPDSYDMRALCRHSTNVGATMLGAMLRRLSQPVTPILIAGFLDEPEFHGRVTLAVKTAALARRFNGLRIGRLGLPMPGYDHLGLSPEEAKASGFDLIDVPLEDWTARVWEYSATDIQTFGETIFPKLLPSEASFARSPDLDRALRLALALDQLANELALDCGAIACRGPFGDGMENGAISCLATALLAHTGRPFAATGDMITSVAMLIGRTLGGATLYCELDAVDRQKDAFLVANTGEADIAWTPPGGRLEIRDASVHSGRQVPGVVIRQDLTAGPATMLGATIDRTKSERLSLIALDGHTLEPANTALNVTNGWFQTTKRPALLAFEAWANAGATHHGALSPGRLGEATAWLGKLCGFPVTEISSEGS